MDKRTTDGPVESATDAKQGKRGTPVLMVLVVGLILAMIAWGAAEIFGESTDDGARIDTSEQSSGDTNQPNVPSSSPSTQ
ncbi:hypothetical protein M8997_003760 [Phyllobacterium sp. 21LDTY02-6]|nr:hypothetical protein [Phyllobacterium sp. 21LDTY02-6]MCO4316291.1 hypothetical protein [Phyllobacterium sp. 21LDTY02-6]MCX8292519.1 hypothetical protein [Phyllobacterium sp. 0TCS1.6A]